MQDFYDAARDDGLWKDGQFVEGELRESFNDVAELVDEAGDDGGHVPDFKDAGDGG